MNRPAVEGGEYSLRLLVEGRSGLAFGIQQAASVQPSSLDGLLFVAPAAGIYAGKVLTPAALTAAGRTVDRIARQRLWPARGLYVDNAQAAGAPAAGAAGPAGLRWMQAGRGSDIGYTPPSAVAVAAAESFGHIASSLGASASTSGTGCAIGLLGRMHAAIRRLGCAAAAGPPDAGEPRWTTELRCVADRCGSVEAAVLGRFRVSRGLWRQVLRQGYLIRNGRPAHGRDLVAPGDVVEVLTPAAAVSAVVEQRGPLAVRYEDDDLLVIDKPTGMLVHPARGEATGTLANRVAAYLAARRGDPTPRPVGRLDRGTSGLIVFAKTRFAQQALLDQHRSGCYHRTYLAVTGPGSPPGAGVPSRPGDGPVELIADVVSPPYDPERYPSPRRALTRVRMLAAYPGGSLVQAQPATGRTHQIRQHLSGAGLALWGDREYGGPPGPIGRPALHAWRLEFSQPVSGVRVAVRSPLPYDMRKLLSQLRAGRLVR